MDASRETYALSSMTGFASAQGAADGWSWNVEMRSVNGRGLDIRLRLPDWIDGLEPELRKTVQGRLNRGTVNVNVRVQRDETAPNLSLSRETLQRTLDVLQTISEAANARGVALRDTSAAEIAMFKGVVEHHEGAPEDTKALKAAILTSAAQCLADFAVNRDSEGQAIAAVIDEQINRVESLIAAARDAVGDREVAAKEAMQRAIGRLLDAAEAPDEARLLQELALIAVKSDVTEEIDRLTAHVEAARALMRESGAVGRKFDFLMQEFNREANTLCSKSQSKGLTAVGLDLKAVIDQMREQVQNIE